MPHRTKEWLPAIHTFTGFELLRQLTKEFSLRNRAEALSLKTQLLARVFAPDPPDPSSGSSQVSDVIRQTDLACARFMRMVGTLGAGMASGLHKKITDLFHCRS